MRQPDEPTIPGLMADPLIRSVMRADGVDPRALEAMLNSLARGTRRLRPSNALDVLRPPSAPGPLCGSSCSW